MARAIFEPLGVQVEYLVVPWARALQDGKSGLYDGVIGASQADAVDFIFPDEPVAINYLGFFTTQTSRWVFTGREAVSSVSLGVIKGYDYRPWLTAYIEKNKANPRLVQVMVGDQPLETNLKKLAMGRIDAIVDSQTAVWYTARTLGLTDSLRLAGVDPEPAAIHIAFSPAKPQSTWLAAQFSRGVRELRNSGKLAEILAKYGLPDWKTR